MDFQTFPLINYDVSNVNKLSAPVSMEADNVPITSGAVASNNLEYYPPNEAFGWHGSNKNSAAFDSPIVDFFNNDNPMDAYLGSYFGGKGWPAFYNPENTTTSLPSGIPSGANIFDLSPLDIHGALVHTSHFDGNRWLLTSSGGGAIKASAAGGPVSIPKPTTIGLNFTDEAQRNAFATDITSMQASGEPVSFSVSTDKNLGVFGSFVSYDPSSSVRSYTVENGGSGYGPDTEVVISAPSLPGGVVAMGRANIGKGGVIQSIGILPTWGGSGYTSPPTVTFMDPSGQGHGAMATADITGGAVTLNFTKALPPEALNRGISLDFNRTATDYAATDITNLWYSWAHYYVEQFSDFGKPETLEGSQVYGSIGDKKGLLTNAITLESVPAKALAVGMGVTSNETGLLPSGTTILKIVGNTVYLSQIPNASANKTQQYTFSAPTELPINATSAKYTKTYELSFSAADSANAELFAGSVYESMQAQSVNTPASAYLPDTMNVVAHVIKFYADLPTHKEPWGTELVGQIRDTSRSQLLRGL